MLSGRTVLIVEDDFLIADYLQDLCNEIGVEVVAIANDAPSAIKQVRERRPDFALMDVRLGGRSDGVDVAKEVAGELPKTRVIFVTGSSEPSRVARMLEANPHRVLIKPVAPAELVEAFEYADDE